MKVIPKHGDDTSARTGASVAVFEQRVRLRWSSLERLRRPQGMVEATRWLFGVLALVSLALTLPGALSGHSVSLRVYAVAAVLVAGVSVVVVFVRRRATFVGDIVDAGAIFGLAVAGPDPAVGFCFLFSSLWFRGCTAPARVRC